MPIWLASREMNSVSSWVGAFSEVFEGSSISHPVSKSRIARNPPKVRRLAEENIGNGFYLQAQNTKDSATGQTNSTLSHEDGLTAASPSAHQIIN
jgi:hypothetical protein